MQLTESTQYADTQVRDWVVSPQKKAPHFLQKWPVGGSWYPLIMPSDVEVLSIMHIRILHLFCFETLPSGFYCAGLLLQLLLTSGSNLVIIKIRIDWSPRSTVTDGKFRTPFRAGVVNTRTNCLELLLCYQPYQIPPTCWTSLFAYFPNLTVFLQ